VNLRLVAPIQRHPSSRPSRSACQVSTKTGEPQDAVEVVAQLRRSPRPHLRYLCASVCRDPGRIGGLRRPRDTRDHTRRCDVNYASSKSIPSLVVTDSMIFDHDLFHEPEDQSQIRVQPARQRGDPGLPRAGVGRKQAVLGDQRATGRSRRSRLLGSRLRRHGRRRSADH
jgi:hypothetical protein